MKVKFRILTIACIVLSCNVHSQVISGPTDTQENTSCTFVNTNGTSGAEYDYVWEYQGDPTVISESETSVILEWSFPGVYLVSLWKDFVIGTDNDEFVERVNIKVGNPPSIEFTYDDAGNRTKREIVYLPSNSILKSIENPTDVTGANEEEVKEEIEAEFDALREFNVYPNPATTTLYISLNEEAIKDKNSRILLFDSMGRLMQNKIVRGEVVSMDLSGLKKGSYIVKVIYAGGSRESKVIVY